MSESESTLRGEPKVRAAAIGARHRSCEVSSDSMHAPAIRPQPRSRFKRMSPAAKYAVVLFGVALLVVVAQLVLHSMRSEPRDSRMIADRELAVNVIEPGERIEQVVSVVRRVPVDYFRATRGI